MIRLLINIFIGRSADVTKPAVRKKYGFLSGITSIILNLLLFTAKLSAGILSGAVSVVADAVNNLSDAGSSLVNIAGFKIASAPPDKEHPFGHGRAEYISGLIISFLIGIMGVELAKSSIEKIISPQMPDFGIFTFVMLGVSVPVKLWMFFFNRALAKDINSVSMKAAASDSLSDTAATLAVIAGALLTRFAGINADGFIGLPVSAFILFSGIKAAKESLSSLMGQMPDKELARSIRSVVCANENILGIHDLIIHNYGVGISFISLHAEISSRMTFTDAHNLIDETETELRKKFGCQVTIHPDPIDTDDEETNSIREKITLTAKEIDETLSIHDLRCVKAPSGKTVIFDLVIPYKFRLTEAETKRVFCEKASLLIPDAVFIINAEKQMTDLD